MIDLLKNPRYLWFLFNCQLLGLNFGLLISSFFKHEYIFIAILVLGTIAGIYNVIVSRAKWLNSYE